MNEYKNMCAVNIDIVTALRAIGNNVGTGTDIRNIILHGANHIEELRETIRELREPTDPLASLERMAVPTKRGRPAKPVTAAQLAVANGPQPGDLDYDDSQNTSKGVE